MDEQYEYIRRMKVFRTPTDTDGHRRTPKQSDGLDYKVKPDCFVLIRNPAECNRAPSGREICFKIELRSESDERGASRSPKNFEVFIFIFQFGIQEFDFDIPHLI